MGQAVALSTASVPTDYCPPSLAVAWPFLVGLMSAELTGANSTFNFGPTTPAPDDQDKPWFRTDGDGNPDRLYVFSDGSWISKHPIAAGAVWMFDGLEADIETYDGGEAGTVTATTGPMWEKYSAMNGRFPVGPGTIGTGTGAVNVGVGGTGGAHEHTLALDEIPKHSHPFTAASYVDGGNNTPVKIIGDDDWGNDTITVDTPAGGQTDGTTKAVNTLPPYSGIWFIRKTARTHYRI